MCVMYVDMFLAIRSKIHACAAFVLGSGTNIIGHPCARFFFLMGTPGQLTLQAKVFSGMAFKDPLKT